MSDPFSIAGGAVGIISLGIQLCKEIISYAAAWRGHDDDIQAVGMKAEELQTALKALHEIVEGVRLTDPAVARDLNQKAISLQCQIEKVKRHIDQYRPALPDSSISKFRNKLKKAAYPITARDALCSMKADMDSMQSTIQTVLAIFNAQKVQKSESRQEKMFQLIEEMHLAMRSASPGTIPAPGLLRSFCDRHVEYKEAASQYSQLISKNGVEGDPTYKAWYAAQPSLGSVHRSKRKFRAKLVEKSYQYHSYWLNRAIALSYSVSTGAGGFSFAPVLGVQTIRGEHSWVAQRLRMFNTFDHLIFPLYDGNLDDLVHEFQNAFHDRSAAPSDIVSYGGYCREPAYSLVDSFTPILAGQERHSVYRFVHFMIECGSIPNNTFSLGVLSQLCSEFRWVGRDYTFASHLIDLGGPITFLPRTRLGRHNMKGLLLMDEDYIKLPDIGKIILRESDQELREALNRNTAQPDQKIRALLLLELAIGWPLGVHILMEFGANAKAVSLGCACYPLCDTDDDDCDAYCASITPLLKAGCKFDAYDIFSCRSKTVRSLLIQELARRRRKLWDLAQSNLPPNKAIEFYTRDDSIIDAQAASLHAELLAQGWEIDCSLPVDCQTGGRSLYHCREAFTEASEELYRAGFRDIDIRDNSGFTPLMLFNSAPWMNMDPFQRKIEMCIWLVSKGANLAELLPNSNATVAHHISSVVVEKVFRVIQGDYRYGTNNWPRFEALITGHKHTVFFVPYGRDDCVCGCCLGGCTTVSVALRKATRMTAMFCELALGEQSGLFRRVYQQVLSWTNSRSGFAQAIIRFFTFEALRLRHTCCTEIDHIPEFGWKNARDRTEIERIREEDQQGLHELEQLVSEFEIRFNELGLPIREFMSRYWYTRMVGLLSNRGPYDEEYHQQTRSLGVFLNADENTVPDVVTWFGSPIELDSDCQTT
ncbi:hypothetical protein BDV38DRAFT_284450 [Aspergillus pseudotamarii]|uniref:Fungal N-terminal domain-containing protein n=1 Tax=Aspergillus pseudotamarii TaxID=132259 RepID=A0A5N6SN25_ASPPS|nr:uncharacterized protein BDV38DRAFT_284450 [Aspergillus pseudotamarii]KAE8135975.1 hypothetical protein BDV38DRAFT_284450 [Aspergillus pseudotamarii]